ncbi:MAG: PIN domain-containing protein [Opitutales bacterium]|nr:PIN domain-containing protein [Opitutales bacterium]
MPAILFDTSVWIAVAFTTHPHHAPAKRLLDSAHSRAPVVACRATQQSFLRLVTTPVIQRHYRSEVIDNTLAWSRWSRLANMPQVLWLREPSGLDDSWQRNACFSSPAPKRWMDAYLAAFAIGYGIPLASFDQDLANFEELEWITPV